MNASTATAVFQTILSAAAELEDHLAILGRWFYGRPRQGEIFLPKGSARRDWPYRRILRACSRLLRRGKAGVKDQAEEIWIRGDRRLRKYR